MRYIFILLLFIYSQISFAQQNIENIIETATCKCIGLFDAFENNDKDKFNDCFVQAVNKNAALLEVEVKKKYGKATYKSGEQFGKSIMQKAIVNMIYTCDAYYKWVEESRYLPIKNANRDSLLNAVQQMNKIDSSKQDVEFHTTRGMSFFSLQQLDEATPDFNNAIKKDSSAALQSMFFKAWSLEIQKKYDDAEKLYSYLAFTTKNNYIRVFEAIVKRKKTKK